METSSSYIYKKRNTKRLEDIVSEPAPEQPNEIKGHIDSVKAFCSAEGPGVRWVVFLQEDDRKWCRKIHPDIIYSERESQRSAEEMLDIAERYHSNWRNGGGITVSGGEPLLQLDFLLELFRQAKGREINTCIETDLTRFTREEPFFTKFAVLMQLTDMMLVHMDQDSFEPGTDSLKDSVRECLEYLSENRKKIWLRYYLVPGMTDRDDILRKTGSLIHSLGNINKVGIIPCKSQCLLYESGDVPASVSEDIERAMENLML